MFIEPFILASFLGGLFLLSFAVAFLFYIYSKDKQLEQLRNSTFKDYDKQIQNAHLKAQRILEQAVESAQKTLQSSEYIKHELIENLEQQIQEVASATVGLLRNQSLDFSKQYKSLLEEMSSENLQIMQEVKGTSESVVTLKTELLSAFEQNIEQVKEQAISELTAEVGEFENEYRQTFQDVLSSFKQKAATAVERIEEIPEHELLDFKNILEKQTVSSQEVISQRINEAFDRAEKEIEVYKQEQIKKVEQKAKEISQRVITDVIGRSLNETDQEKLIIASLNEAKTDGFFSK